MREFCPSGTSYTILRVFLTWFMHSIPTNFVRSTQLKRSEKIYHLHEIYRNEVVHAFSGSLPYSPNLKLNCLFFLFRLKSPLLLYIITRLRFFISNLMPVNVRS
jgi:hypothetical protein